MHMWTGAAVGLAVTVYANALRQVPLLSQPWMHVVSIVTGAYLGYQWRRADIFITNKIREERSVEVQKWRPRDT